MPANTSPIFGLTPNITPGQTVINANTAKDGTGTVVTIYTAGANGSRPIGIKFRAIGSNIQTVARIFLNNGSANSSAGNNTLFAEVNLPATTLSETSSLPDYAYVFPDNFVLPSGWKINITIGTTVAAGYALTAYGADY
jgi:hypothetical protein